MTEQTRPEADSWQPGRIVKADEGDCNHERKGPSQSGTAPILVPNGGGAPVPAAHAAPSVSTDGAPPGSPGMPQSWVPQNAFAPPETPYTPFVPPQAASPIVGKFWAYQPSVAPNYEPNESRNPPTAAYSGQEVPHRKMQMVQAVDRDSGALRSVSPTAYVYEQTRVLNAQYVPRGWMELPSGLHPVYS